MNKSGIPMPLKNGVIIEMPKPRAEIDDISNEEAEALLTPETEEDKYKFVSKVLRVSKLVEENGQIEVGDEISLMYSARPVIMQEEEETLVAYVTEGEILAIYNK
jgi:hypothetical protein